MPRLINITLFVVIRCNNNA